MADHRFQLHLWEPTLANNTTVTIETLGQHFLDQIGTATGVHSSLVRVYDNYKDDKKKTLTAIIVPFPTYNFQPDSQTGLLIKPSGSATVTTNLKQASFSTATFQMGICRFTRIYDSTDKKRVLSAKYYSRELFFTTVDKEVKTNGKITKFEGDYNCQGFGGKNYAGWTLMEGKKGYLDISMDQGLNPPMQVGTNPIETCYSLGIRYGTATNKATMQSQCDTYFFFDGFIVNRFADGQDFDGEDAGDVGTNSYNIAGLAMYGVCIEPGNGLVRDKINFNNLEVNCKIKNDIPIIENWEQH